MPIHVYPTEPEKKTPDFPPVDPDFPPVDPDFPPAPAGKKEGKNAQGK